MMKSEFENLAGRAVTNEQYRAIESVEFFYTDCCSSLNFSHALLPPVLSFQVPLFPVL